MKIEMRCQMILVLLFIALSTADNNYQNKLTKLWSLSSATSDDSPRTAVLNVTSASILIQPTSRSNDNYARTAKVSKLPYDFKKYAFKPRAIPLRRSDQQSQIEKNFYYSQEALNNYKPQVLFPGNYLPIAEAKGNENITEKGGPFQPKAIPLLREVEFEKRSLDVDEEPIIEKPEGFIEPTASRRSISYLMGVDEDDEEEAEDEEEGEVTDDEGKKHKKPKGKKKIKKLSKYMLPLLLAYKLKYFALIPLLISGLVLIVGATGLAGFFFALFAAVMGLQKGGY